MAGISYLFFHLFFSTFKRRAPRAIKVIREFAKKTMGTSDVKLDASINTHIWSKGVKGVPRRIRVKLERYAFFVCFHALI